MKRKFKIISGCLCACILGLCTLINASAANENYSAITVSPPNQKITLIPGEEYRGTLTVTNSRESTEDMHYYLSVLPYSISDGNYNDPDITNENSLTQMTEWITYDWTEGILGIGESAEIPYTINVPNDVAAGGQYALLVARGVSESEQSSEDGFNVSGIRQIGSILYATVAGDTRASGEIIENKIPSFITGSSFAAYSTVKNDGNIHADATYSLQVFPLFSDEEVFTNEEDPEVNLILPDTSYYNTVEWNNPPTVGIFRAVQTIEFLGETSVTEKIVVVCPIWLLFIILFVIVAVVIWLVARVKGRKKSNK